MNAGLKVASAVNRRTKNGSGTHRQQAALGGGAVGDAGIDAALPGHGILAHGLHARPDADGVVPRADRRRHVRDGLQPRRALPAPPATSPAACATMGLHQRAAKFVEQTDDSTAWSPWHQVRTISAAAIPMLRTPHLSIGVSWMLRPGAHARAARQWAGRAAPCNATDGTLLLLSPRSSASTLA